MKLIRQPDPGGGQDLEIGRFLTEPAPEVSTPIVAGYLEYQRRGQQPMTLGILQELVPSEGSAWAYTLDSLARYFERVLSQQAGDIPPAPVQTSLLLELMTPEAQQREADLSSC